ncbi:MAG: DNA mismatch repair protein MutS [Lachnospiraceae bacterium]|nr:DNA mismatch repair protein MutS [Lachnospiraceae bacterium]
MMQQYLKTRSEYPGCILFYRLGDFYEMFFDDAITVSRELELTLTGKSCGAKERAPMCGVPYHAADTYLARLVKKGYSVAICEQVEDPKTAKGLVRREVTRIVTPGTNIDPLHLDETKNNYLCTIYFSQEHYGLSAIDVSTGEFLATETTDQDQLFDELIRFDPKEILCNESFRMSGFPEEALLKRIKAAVHVVDENSFLEEHVKVILTTHFHVSSIDGLGLMDMPYAAAAAGAVLTWLFETQKNSLAQVLSIRPYQRSAFLMLDSTTRRNLELTETLREKERKGSLLWVLDRTRTAMGARRLRSMIHSPMVDKLRIEERLDAVEELKEKAIPREELREYLGSVYDLERLLTRITYQTANARDLLSFKSSLSLLPAVKTILQELEAPLFQEFAAGFDPMQDLFTLVEEAIVEEPPLTIREGGIIKEGYNTEADRLKSAETDGTGWLKELEEKEREATGIKNLRVRYNKVFGYYIEITNSALDKVPERYIRKQTLTTGERYITPELKEMEDTILGAREKLIALEYELFCSIRDRIAGEVVRIKKTADILALLDAVASLSHVASANRYVRPAITEDGCIRIKNGRHPVVEKMAGAKQFVPNDCFLDGNENRISIITGPNMAGKSTYMRQVALIVLMAQMGSFVPAESASIGLTDRIFTRVGASDDLASGQSTFMVEMTEVANILHNATKNSLLILDEIGRGTSTFDGLSIARAVVEHISNPSLLGARTLFATHYHELTELEGKLFNVHNYRIAVKESGDSIVFLRKIVPGGADKSYGIEVARLAGVPESVTRRAEEIAEELNRKEPQETRGTQAFPEEEPVQLSLFDPLPDPVIDEIKNLDLTNMTPLEALNCLHRLQEELKR